VLTLFQAEWCPYSSRVRQRLTELMLPFVAHPVEPEPEDRDELRRVANDDSIPVLLTESREPIGDADAIIAWLDANYAEPQEVRGHRAQARAHGSIRA
jgi:glutathione S-transferase